MKVERRIHQIYKETKDIPNFRQLVGKYQYIYTSPKGRISLVYFPNYLRIGDNFWEAYQLEGNVTMIEDVERFRTNKEAMARISVYLD